VLAPGLAEPDAVRAFAERLREIVGAEPLSVSLRLLRITVSVGGTTLDGSLDPQAAVARADEALYRAKRRRNASVVELPPESARLALAHS